MDVEREMPIWVAIIVFALATLKSYSMSRGNKGVLIFCIAIDVMVIIVATVLGYLHF